MKIAAAYVRVSTEKQDEYSLDSQLKLIREYANAHDMLVPDEFVFVEDGISGRYAKKRRAFQDMIALAKDKDSPFEVILVWKFSRFARNQEESIFYKSMLSRSGVDVVSISEPLDDSPFGSLIERIIEWMDEFYSIRLSGEVQRGMAEKVSRAEIVTVPSFGYDVQGKTYVPNQYADVVRRIFADFLGGKGAVTIARELADAGIRTRRGSVPSNRWVLYILRNPVYVGKIRWSTGGKVDYVHPRGSAENAILVDGGFEPIVDTETFDAVQEKLRLRAADPPYTRHDQPTDWMLKGLVRCSACGATLVYSALACPSMQCYRYAHGQCSVSHSLSIAKANRAVIEGLQRSVDLGSFQLAPEEELNAADSADYDRLIAVEKSKLRRVQDAYEAGVDSLVEYAVKKKKLTAGIEELMARKSASRSRKPISIEEMRDRVKAALITVKNPDASERVKADALRSVLAYAVYHRSPSRIELFFKF